MKQTTVFITYNPHNDDEQTLAIRLHSIGVANGFRMFLPDRFNSNRLGGATKTRIDESDYFILFSMNPNITEVVAEEINYAWQKFKDKKRIIVIHGGPHTRILPPESVQHCTEIFFDARIDHMDVVIQKIMSAIFTKEAVSKLQQHSTPNKGQQDLENALLALLGIGLGLLVLNAVTQK